MYGKCHMTNGDCFKAVLYDAKIYGLYGPKFLTLNTPNYLYRYLYSLSFRYSRFPFKDIQYSIMRHRRKTQNSY